ncbi:unnamed protein product, partial [marine sediment metagenome]
MMLKSSHDKLRDRIADDYRQKGYHVSTEKQIGNRRVDIYAENEEEVLIIEVVDTSYSGSLDRKSINQIKIQINNKPISQHSANSRIGRGEPRERVSLTLPQECVDWIEKKIKSRKYANYSHAIE